MRVAKTPSKNHHHVNKHRHGNFLENSNGEEVDDRVNMVTFEKKIIMFISNITFILNTEGPS
jgi:hypothetical protein